MKKIYTELARIQQELKAPKNLYNSFGKYSYRNAEGILEAVKPLLGGLALIINDEPVVIGERFYIKATVTITDGEESVSAVATTVFSSETSTVYSRFATNRLSEMTALPPTMSESAIV